jgi:hypothetical protein
MKIEDFNNGTPFQQKEFKDLDDLEGPVRLFYTEDNWTKLQSYWSAQSVHNSDDTEAAFTDYFFTGNLWVSQVSANLAEKSLIEPHMSDSASVYFFGKSPTVLSIQGIILHPYDGSHKKAMILAYQNAFRLYTVARSGAVPNLSFTGYLVPGAMLKMDLAESSEIDRALQISFDWLVFSLKVQSPGNESSLGVTETAIEFSGYAGDTT